MHRLCCCIIQNEQAGQVGFVDETKKKAKKEPTNHRFSIWPSIGLLQLRKRRTPDEELIIGPGILIGTGGLFSSTAGNDYLRFRFIIRAGCR